MCGGEGEASCVWRSQSPAGDLPRRPRDQGCGCSEGGGLVTCTGVGAGIVARLDLTRLDVPCVAQNEAAASAARA